MSWQWTGYAILDRPDRFGRVAAWGWSRDWLAMPDTAERQYAITDPRYMPVWRSTAGQIEWLEPLAALAPRGYIERRDMALEEWEVQGEWQLSERTAALGDAQWLRLVQPGTPASAVSASPMISDGEACWILILDRPEDGSEQEGVERWLRVGLRWEGTPAAGLMLHVPLASEIAAGAGSRDPMLLGVVDGQTDPTIIARWDNGPRGGVSGAAGEQIAIRWSSIADGTLIEFGGEQWFVRRMWQDASGYWHESVVPAGASCYCTISLHEVVGVVWAGQLRYPARVELKPDRWLSVPSNWACNEGLRSLGWYVRGRGQCGAQISVETEPLVGGMAHRPRVVLVSAGTSRAAACSVATWNNPEWDEGGSEEISTQDNPSCRLVEAAGSVGEAFRDGQAQLVVRKEAGAEPPQLWPSTFVQIWLREPTQTLPVEEGEEPEEPQEHCVFTGWAQVAEETTGTSGTTYRLEASDGWERLERSSALSLARLAGWPVQDAYQHILELAGFPPERIYLDDVGSEDLPLGPLGSRELLAFQPDARLSDVLDGLDRASGYRTMISPSGMVQVVRDEPPEPGSYDVELVPDPEGGGRIIESVLAERVGGEFVNRLAVLVGGGEHPATHMKADWDSIRDPDALSFVGTTLDEVLIATEAEDAEMVAEREWDRLRGDLLVATIDLINWAPIWPRMRVLVNVPNVGVPEGTICRVRRMSWRLTSEWIFRQTLELVAEELPE